AEPAPKARPLLGRHGPRIVVQRMVETGSVLAEELLRDWPETVGRFWQAVPKEMLSRLHHPLDDNARAMPAE
ncbi:MAG: hypothetical protein AAFR44_14350, partial [Pseudomonadota bacterium]